MTGSACMHRSTTCIKRLMTHSRLSPVLRMALSAAAFVSSRMRLDTARLSRSHLAVVAGFNLLQMAAWASR